jgi:hypothetical protein
MHLVVASLVAMSTMRMSCLTGGIIDAVKESTDKTVALLDQATSDIGNNLSSWQTVLKDLESKLVGDAQSTVRNEVQTLLSSSIGVANAGLRCDIDFVGARVLQGLARIKARLLDQPPPPPRPATCEAAPSGVEFAAWQQGRVPKIDLFGYDLEAPLALFLVSSGDVSAEVSSSLSRISHYQVAINLGSNGVPLNAASQRIELRSGGGVISAIPIIQPVTPPCQTRTDQFRGANITHTPTHVRGDKEFNGNGPSMSARLSLSSAATEIRWELSMRAKETKSDWSEAVGSASGVFYSPPAGWHVERVTPTLSTFAYVDTNTTLDVKYPGSGPVQRFEFIGDTQDDDIGETGVVVFFHPVAIDLVQTGNCVSPSVVRSMQRRGELSAPLLERFRSSLIVVPQ